MPVGPDGFLIPYTDVQVASWGLESFEVRNGSHPTEVFGIDGATSERTYFCEWNTRYDTIAWLVGEVALYVDGGGDTKVSRIVPQAHPDPLFQSLWFCTKILSITGHVIIEDSPSTLPDPQYQRAEVKCLFEPVTYKVRGDLGLTSELQRYTIEPGFPFNDINTATEYVTMPGGILNYLTPTGELTPPYTKPHMTPIPYGIGFPMVREKFSYTWERVPYGGFEPSSNLRQRVQGTASARPYLGSVNKTTFGNYQAGTLQLQGCEPRLMLDPTGKFYVWRIKYVMEYAPDGMHNLYFFDSRRNPDGSPITPGLSGWYQVGRGPAYQTPGTIVDNTTLFPEREFADLWVVGDV